MASTRPFVAGTGCNTIQQPFLTPVVPGGTGPYTYFADGVIWDEGATKAVPAEKTDHPSLFIYGGRGVHK